MKRIFLALIIVILLLISVLLMNTLRFSSRQLPVEPVSMLDVDENIAARHLAQAVRFQTISYQDTAKMNANEFLAFRTFLEKTFPKVHATLKREIVNSYSLLYTWKGKDETLKPVLYMAHQDVVPVEANSEKDWQQPPFAGVINDGFIWGRGTIDDKVSVLGILEAVETLIGQGFQPTRTIYLAFGHDEEVGGQNGATKITDLLNARHIEFDYILDEGLVIADGILPVPKPVALIGIAEKGYLSVELSTEVQGGHSSMPPSYSAIGIISAAVHNLEIKQMPEGIKGANKLMFDYIGPEMAFGKKLIFSNLWLFKPLVMPQLSASPATNAALRTTTALTIIEGGFKENVLPTRARAVVNFRILPGDSVEDVLSHVKDVINDPRVKISTYGEPGWAASPVSDVNSPEFQLLQQTIRQVFPDVVAAPAQVLGGTDARYYAKLSPNVYRFIPIYFKQVDLKRPHGIDERISIKNYAQCITFYFQLIKNSAQ